MSSTQQSTRYQTVQGILDAAAGGSTADYGGVGRFWHLTLQEFLEFELGGVRLLTTPPPPRSPCCGGGEEAPAPEPEFCGATSGLVRGLRGQAPFDDLTLPRLPWGGEAVDEADIAFIASWIDDGCPASDRVLLHAAVDAVATEVALEVVEPDNAGDAPESPIYEVLEGPANAYKFERGELKQRMNIDCMDEASRERLRLAFRELYRLNKYPQDKRSYNALAFIHQNHCQHGWERFLPWHRVYMYEFEQALQDVCPEVTLPYWDWTMPQYTPARPDKGWRIPQALQAFLTPASVEFLEGAKPPLPKSAADGLREKIVGRCYPSPRTFFDAVAAAIGEEFTRGEHRNRFLDALLAANALWYPLRYPGEYQASGKTVTINEAVHYHYPTADDIAQIMSLRSFRDFGGGSLYNEAFGFLDQNPHNTMHIWTGGMNPDAPGQKVEDRNRGVKVVGRQFHRRSDLYSQPANGDMFSNLTAAFDPVFWPVHSNVDRLWAEWQEAHPHSNPVELDAVLTPWSYTIRDTLDIHRFGYEYVKSTHLLPVGRETPVGRFVSQKIAIPKPVRSSFAKAEVRLHRVPQLPRSCFIRVFLNLPDANAGTSIRDDHYAGYIAIFGHGPCIGGPGHCAIPPEQARKFDRRPRDHNTPRNHRLDVSVAARRLLAKGATELTITLVVVGVDYQEERELLRLDGVSLNFLD